HVFTPGHPRAFSHNPHPNRNIPPACFPPARTVLPTYFLPLSEPGMYKKRLLGRCAYSRQVGLASRTLSASATRPWECGTGISCTLTGWARRTVWTSKTRLLTLGTQEIDNLMQRIYP
ncbi:hypothetical protein BGY98DRAFT_1002181, partial [Russula aff. rugulosa BPL654]